MIKMPDASTLSAAPMPVSSANLTAGVKALSTAAELPLESGTGM